MRAKMQEIDLLFDINKFHEDQRRYRIILMNVMDRYNSGQTQTDFWYDYVKLDRVIKNWEKAARQIPCEMVECRRRKRPTQKFEKLLKEYKEYSTEVESLMVMYSLIYN